MLLVWMLSSLASTPETLGVCTPQIVSTDLKVWTRPSVRRASLSHGAPVTAHRSGHVAQP